MKRSAVLIMALLCVLTMAGCIQQGGTEQNAEKNRQETGYPDGEIQRLQIQYNGQMYFYCATGFDDPLPYGYAYAGSILGVDNVNGPEEDFWGARVDLGQEIYASERDPDTIYVKYDNGYARFTIPE